MGKRGPKPTPTPILKLRGSWRAKIRQNELMLPASVPEPPAWLKDEGLAEWNRVVPKLAVVGVLNELDRAALAVYCQAWGDFCDILPYCSGKPIETKSGEKIATGALIKRSSGDVVQNPALRIRRTLSCLVLKAAAEFGMTPAGRVDVRLNKPNKQEQAAEKFFEKLNATKNITDKPGA